MYEYSGGDLVDARTLELNGNLHIIIIIYTPALVRESNSDTSGNDYNMVGRRRAKTLGSNVSGALFRKHVNLPICE